MSTDNVPSHSHRFFLRRTLILGSSVFAASLLSGLGMLFWREHGDHLFTIPADFSELLIRATLGPLYVGVVFLFPVTMPVMFVLTILVLVGSTMRRIWLSALAFVLMGAYWLWVVKLFSEGAFD